MQKLQDYMQNLRDYLKTPQDYLKWMMILAAAVMFSFGGILYGLSQPVSSHASNAVLVMVKPGMSTLEIGNLLKEQGLIKNALFFRVLARLEGLDNFLQAGEYEITNSMSIGQIVSTFAEGKTTYKQITIPEGYTVVQVAALLERKNLASAAKFKALAASYNPYGYADLSQPVNFAAEGYLFPDTYRIAAGTSEEQILEMMVSRFNEQFTPQMRQRANEVGLSVQRVIILASLVEREARVPKDRPIIAGVFLNRLKVGMPLQSCATIQYILGDQKPELTVQDTEIASPYNTYRHSGLPPGPIAAPGIASINAVLYPAKTDYLYFVADKNGAHRFSKSYEEHLAAIQQLRQ